MQATLHSRYVEHTQRPVALSVVGGGTGLQERLGEIENQREWLVRFLQRRVRSNDDAEDLVQNVLLHATEKAGTFRGECPLSQWVLKIAINELGQYNGRSLPRTRRLVPFEDATMEVAAPSEQADDSVAERLAAAAREACTDLERRITFMVYRGDNFEEIADDLDMKPATVRSRFLRGRSKLLAHLFSTEDDLIGTSTDVELAMVAALRDQDAKKAVSPAEESAFRNKKYDCELYRSACVKIARHLPLHRTCDFPDTRH